MMQVRGSERIGPRMRAQMLKEIAGSQQWLFIVSLYRWSIEGSSFDPSLELI